MEALINKRLSSLDLAERLRIALRPVGALQNAAPRDAAGARESTREPGWIFNAPRDSIFAHPFHEAFDNVLTLFTQEWVGIRAASGSFPGAKLAISKDMIWNTAEIQRVIHEIDEAKIKIIVAQGASFASLNLLVALRIAMPELRIVGVWHGTLAAWALDEERTLATRFIELASRDVFDQICLMRKGSHLLHRKAVKYLTPNLVPNCHFRRIVPAMDRRPITAVFPGWNNPWKNMYTNLIAAAASEKVKRVVTYSPASLPGEIGKKLVSIPYAKREQHFSTLANCDLVLNVTTVDCHPMVELEALAVNTPVLRGQLDLDFGENHLFTTLFTENSIHDASAIRNRLEKVVEIPSGEIASIVSDYRNLVVDTSFARYGEFLKA